MTVRVSKPEFNLRDKLSELDKPVGVKGSELMKAETIEEARSFMGSGRRNLIINGGFDIWQRATDSGSNTSDGYLSADRWQHASSGATKQVTRQAFTLGQTEVPGNPKYFLRYAVTSSHNNVAMRQCIEDVTRTAGRELTFSFWVKGSNCGGGSFDLQFRQNFGTGGSASSVVDTGHFSYTVNDIWTRKTFTFTPPSILGKTLGTAPNSSFYKIELFRQPDGDTSTAAFTLDFANVQLEYGSQATEFEQRTLDEEYELCQRYYQRAGGLIDDGDGFHAHPGWSWSSGSAATRILFNKKMRAEPSCTLVGTPASSSTTPAIGDAGTMGVYGGNSAAWQTPGTWLVSNVNETGIRLQANSYSTFGLGKAVGFYMYPYAGIKCDAELTG